MNTTPDILCIGSVLWDTIGRASLHMQHGADVPGRITRRPGGVAMNIAMTLARFGLRPSLLSAIGRDADGDELVAAAQRMGLDCSYLYRSEDLPTDRYMAVEGANGLIAAIADAHSLEAAGDKILRPLGDGRLGSLESPWAGPVALDGNSRGIETNGSAYTSPGFTAAAGDRLNLWFNYASTDGKGFDDYAWARLVDAGSGQLVAWLFTARSSNSSTGNIVPGDVVDREAFDPDQALVNYDAFEFQTRDATNPIAWTPLGYSDGACWKENAQGCGFTGWLQSRHAFAAGGSYRVEIGVVNWGDEAYDSGLAFDFNGLVSSVPEPGAGASLLAGLAVLAGLRRRRA